LAYLHFAGYDISIAHVF